MFRKTIAAIFLLIFSTGVVTAQFDNQDQAELAGGNIGFAFDIYREVAQANEGNLMISPYSISQALAMTYAGARGNTEQQMAEVLHFSLPQATLHSAFQAQTEQLNSNPAASRDEEQYFELHIVNALWGEQTFSFNPDFVSLLNEQYSADMNLMDFMNAPEPARETINAWVEDQTEERIKNLLTPGTITPGTRLVLTNAIYFNAAWAEQFDPELTEDQPFYLLDGSTVTVPLMQIQESYRYYAGEDYQVLEMPYVGYNTSMLILLPQEGRFEAVEQALDVDLYQNIWTKLQYGAPVQVYLPRFSYEFEVSLPDTLRALGMTDAFDPNVADFTGMISADNPERLVISDVIHKAFVEVDEEGTEAAAATAVIMETTAAPEPQEPIVFRVDRPFLYLIYDHATGTILFMGRVLNPAE